MSVGIDLGTTNSEIYQMTEEGPKAVLGPSNQSITPSRVAVDINSTKDPIFLHGAKAKRVGTKHPENYLFECKRLIGRKYDDDFVRYDRLFWPFTVVEGFDGLPYYSVTGKDEPLFVSPDEVSAEILNRLVGYKKGGVKNAVITIPSYFNQKQIDATRRAGEIAGLNVLDCLPEPVAACIAYGYRRNMLNGTILVYDLGGGTFDCCIVHVEAGHYKVLISDGNMHLGGSNFDNAISKVMVERIEESSGYNIFHDKKIMAKMKQEVENLKIILTDEYIHEFSFDFRMDKNIHFSYPFTRQEFNNLIEGYINSTLRCIQRSLEQINLEPGDIDEVILVGGSTRIPLVQSKLNSFFNRVIPTDLVNIDEAVAEGAAIYADDLMKGGHMFSNGFGPTAQKVDEVLNGGILEEIPFNIYLNTGNGPKLLFEKGRRWKNRDEESVIRVVEEVNPRINFCKSVPFKVYSENPTNHNLQLIGRMDFTVDPDYRSSINLHVISEYNNRGHIRISVRLKGTQIQDAILITCRGDHLDDYEEKTRLCQLGTFEYEVNRQMIQSIQGGNNPQLVFKRIVLMEILSWLSENSIDYDDAAFELMKRKFRSLL